MATLNNSTQILELLAWNKEVLHLVAKIHHQVTPVIMELLPLNNIQPKWAILTNNVDNTLDSQHNPMFHSIQVSNLHMPSILQVIHHNRISLTVPITNNIHKIKVKGSTEIKEDHNEKINLFIDEG